MRDDQTFDCVEGGVVVRRPNEGGVGVFGGEGVQDTGEVGELGEEQRGVVDKAEERVNVMRRCRGWPLQDFVDFATVGGDPIVGDTVAEEVEVSAEQLSFLKRTVEIVSVEGLEDQFDVTLMLLQRLRPDDDIIEVNMANAANERTERVEHAALVGARSIPTTLRHHGPFVQAKRSGDRGIFDMI